MTPKGNASERAPCDAFPLGTFPSVLRKFLREFKQMELALFRIGSNLKASVPGCPRNFEQIDGHVEEGVA